VIRTIRRLAAVGAATALGSTLLIATAGAPAPAAAETVGYTIETLRPAGVVELFRCRLATVDLATGFVSPIGSSIGGSDACARDLAFAPGGGLYGIVQHEVMEAPEAGDTTGTTTGDVAPAAPNPYRVHLVRFDTATGAVTDLGQIGTAPASLSGGGGITFDSAGNLFVYMIGDDVECDETAYCLYAVDPADPGAATFLGDDPQETGIYGLTTACGTGMYTSQTAPRTGSLDDAYVLDGGDVLGRVTTGPPATVTPVGAFGDDYRTVQSLDFASDGTLWAIGTITPKGFDAPGQLSTIDPATGAQTLGPLTTADREHTLLIGLAIAPPSCPEPPAILPTFTG